MAATSIKSYGRLPILLIIAGLIGLTASMVLTYDKLHVLQNPNYTPPCNINPVLSCGSVMKADQANLFGMPNTIFGIIAFTALISFGAVLAAGAVMKRWVWQAAQVVAFLGVVFMHYLFFQSVYRIHAICIWCFITWMVTIPIFWYLTIFNLRAGHIKINNQLSLFLQKHHFNILAIWYGIIFLILLVKFWYYWSTLI